MVVACRQGLLVLLLLGVCLLLCKRERSESGAAADEASATVPMDSATVDYEKIYHNITVTIGHLASDDDTAGKRRILRAAWDSVAGVLYCPGKAVVNPALPEAARKEAAVRAATITARRQAVLFNLWRRNDFRDGGKRMDGQVTYDATVFEQLRQDTLHILLQVPIGSVVID